MKKVLLLCAAVMLALGMMNLAAAEETMMLEPVEESFIASSTSNVGISNEEAIEGFINRVFGIPFVSDRAVPRAPMGEKLTGVDAWFYQYMKEKAQLIAAGELSNTEFLIPFSNLTDTLDSSKYSCQPKLINDEDECIEFTFLGETEVTEDMKKALFGSFLPDLDSVIGSLLVDLPYEMYWYDKTAGANCFYEVSSYTYGNCVAVPLDFGVNLILRVAQEYSVDGTTGSTTYNTNWAQTILSAAERARSVVKANAAKSDWDKLTAYKDAICGMVSYNHSAADDDSTPYGNPWQLIWVFDGDDSTNVVCEGYSKAFKYLCDQSKFLTNVETVIVTGDMGTEAHMWNLVTMGNGKHYLVDVTNCDEGASGAPDQLFMVGYTSVGTTTSTYVYDVVANQRVVSITYSYDDDTINLYGQDALTVAQNAFTENDDPEAFQAEVIAPETMSVTVEPMIELGDISIEYVFGENYDKVTYILFFDDPFTNKRETLLSGELGAGPQHGSIDFHMERVGTATIQVLGESNGIPTQTFMRTFLITLPVTATAEKQEIALGETARIHYEVYGELYGYKVQAYAFIGFSDNTVYRWTKDNAQIFDEKGGILEIEATSGDQILPYLGAIDSQGRMAALSALGYVVKVTGENFDYSAQVNFDKKTALLGDKIYITYDIDDSNGLVSRIIQLQASNPLKQIALTETINLRDARGVYVLDTADISDFADMGEIRVTVKFADSKGMTYEGYRYDSFTIHSADLYLPADLTAIESQAFQNIGARKVYIPANVTSIADDAFDSSAIIVCKENSTAYTWAVNHGYNPLIVD